MRYIFAALVFVLCIGGIILFQQKMNRTLVQKEEKQAISQTVPEKSNMKITSTAFEQNKSIPAKYTCQGDNVNPPLGFVDVLKESKSLALIVDDPDAPSKTWVHWVVYNIPSSVTALEENSTPSGSVQAENDSGKKVYGGPCPPSGTHRYFFKLYALDTTFDLPEFADKAMLEEAMKGHILEQAELIGLYSKEK